MLPIFLLLLLRYPQFTLAPTPASAPVSRAPVPLPDLLLLLLLLFLLLILLLLLMLLLLGRIFSCGVPPSTFSVWPRACRVRVGGHLMTDDDGVVVVVLLLAGVWSVAPPHPILTPPIPRPTYLRLQPPSLSKPAHLHTRARSHAHTHTHTFSVTLWSLHHPELTFVSSSYLLILSHSLYIHLVLSFLNLCNHTYIMI